MIRKLKRRYLITNMILLSCTLLIALGILFCVLYRSQIQSSYTVMHELLNESELPETTDAVLREPAVVTVLPEVHLMEDSVMWGSWSSFQFSTETTAVTSESYTESQQSSQQDQPEQYYWNGGYQDNSGWSMPPYMYWYDPNNPWSMYNPYMYGQFPGYDPNWYTQWQQQQQQQNQEQEQQEYVRTDNDHGPATTTAVSESSQPTTTSASWTMPYERYTYPTYSSWNSIPFWMTTKSDASKTTAASKSESKTTSTSGQTAGAAETKSSKNAEPAKTTAPANEKGAAGLDVSSSKEKAAVRADEGHFVPDAYVARVDENGNIESYAGNSTKDDDEHFRTVHDAMDTIRRRGSDSGTIEIDEVPYRYLYQKDQSGSYQLVLMNRTLEISTLTRMLVIFLLLAIIGLCLMFGLSAVLANWTVTPIACAWEKQKQFVADASHELKTPLAVISANTEVILANPQEHVSGQSKWLSYIQSETMRMSKLITNLLTVARMDDKEQTSEKAEPIQLSELVSNTCLVFEPVIYENGKTLNRVILRNVRICAEEDSVKQLLSILLDNAVLHSTPQAQITVMLSKDAQGKIRLSVSNTAKDIPPEQLSHLFDRFYRLDKEGSPNGSGLGLSIAKSIVHQMGGTLTVTSENQLVTFVATLES